MPRTIVLNLEEVAVDFGMSDDGDRVAMLLTNVEGGLLSVRMSPAAADELSAKLRCLAARARGELVIGDNIGSLHALKKAS